MSSVKFNVQVLSSLISPNSKHTVQQQQTFHVWLFESQCSHVFRCVFGFEKTVDVFESIIVWQTHKVVAAHCHSHILIWIVKQCCTVFASSEASQLSTDQKHIIKLPDVGSVLSCIHALDQSANFVFAILLTILCGKSDVIESLGCSLDMFSAEVAIRTLEEQVNVMHLDFEKRTGTELLANSCSWPWMTRHGGWVDARFRVTTNDPYDSTFSPELLPFGEMVMFRTPLPHTRRNQNRTTFRGDSGWDKGFWCGRLDEDNAHIIVTENGREIARTVRRLPLSQYVDVSWLKRVRRLPWDGQGLVRRGRARKLALERPTSCSSRTRWSSIRPEFRYREGWSGDRADACGKTATFQKQDPRSCSCWGDEDAEEQGSDFGHWRQHQDGSDGRRNTKEDADDDEPADKYWRVEDFVAKASMDDLTGKWLTDENGIFDHDAAEDT